MTDDRRLTTEDRGPTDGGLPISDGGLERAELKSRTSETHRLACANPHPVADYLLPTTERPRRVPPGRAEVDADLLEALRLEACRRCCRNCAFALRPKTLWLRIRLADLPDLMICFNHPEAPGEMRETSRLDVCRNFRFRYKPSFRLKAPAAPGPGICVIPLTKGKHAYVDAEDYDRLMEHKWTAYYTCGKWYAARNDHGKCVLMHREIMKAPKGKVVDHIDGNGLNNCKSNLRICTYSQNNIHRRPRGASSRFKCVYRDRKRNLWKSTPAYRRRSVYNGRYESETDAARASDYMNVQLNGEFAYLNFPAEWPKERVQAVYAEGQTLRDKLDARSDK